MARLLSPCIVVNERLNNILSMELVEHHKMGNPIFKAKV